MTELEGTAAESKATYEEIKEYVLEKTGLKVLVERCTIFGGSFNNIGTKMQRMFRLKFLLIWQVLTFVIMIVN